MNKLLMVLVGGFFLSSAAVAQQITFEELDADSDGAINKEEAAVHEELTAAFDTADADQNGSLSKDEFMIVVPQ